MPVGLQTAFASQLVWAGTVEPKRTTVPQMATHQTSERVGATLFQIWGNRHVEGEKAGDGTRTHDNHVGNVVLYQLSYTRMMPTRRMRIMPVHPRASSEPAIVETAVSRF